MLLSTFGSRGNVEPMVGLAAALRSVGARGLPEFVELAGGTNTTGARTVVPRLADQQYWHSRVAELRIGAAQDGTTTAAAFTTALTCTRAKAVATTIHTDGATAATTLLFDAISRERANVPA